MGERSIDVFIDETGHPGMSTKHIEDRERYFALTALICLSRQTARTEAAIETIVADTFPSMQSNEILIRSVEIRNRRFPFGNLSAHDLHEFTERVYATILEYPKRYQILSVVIDKYEHGRRYVKPEDPYHLAFEFMLERLSYMSQTHDLERANVHIAPRGYKGREAPDRRLKAYENAVMRMGTDYVSASTLKAVASPSIFVRPIESRMIQLADLFSYNIWHAIRYTKPSYSYFIRTLPLLYRHRRSKQVMGSGLKMFPESLANMWAKKIPSGLR